MSHSSIPRAVILAGGRGRRLYPYTNVFPKPLVPIGHKPILELILKQLHYFGVRHVTLCVGYLSELLQTYFGDGRKLGLKIDYVHEEIPLGTAGPLKLVPDLDSDFLMMNGDILCSIDFQQLFDFHKARKCIATVGTYSKTVHIDMGVLTLNNFRYIEKYTEKPTLDYNISMGIYCFSPDVLNHIPAQQYMDIPSLINSLIEQQIPSVAFEFDGHWLDIGRPGDYALAQEFLHRHYAEFHLEPFELDEGPPDTPTDTASDVVS